MKNTLLLVLLLVGCTRQASLETKADPVKDEVYPKTQSTPTPSPTPATAQCVSPTSCGTNGGNPNVPNPGGYPFLPDLQPPATGGNGGGVNPVNTGIGPEREAAQVQAIAAAAAAKQFAADTLANSLSAEDNYIAAQAGNNRIQALNTYVWQEKSAAQNSQIATEATRHAGLARQSSNDTAPLYNSIATLSYQVSQYAASAELNRQRAKTAADNAIAFAVTAQTAPATQAAQEAQTSSTQAQGFLEKATLSKNGAAAVFAAAIGAVNSSRSAAQVAEDAAAVARQPKVFLRFNVPTSSLGYKMWGAWNGEIGNWFITIYDALAFLFHNAAMTRIVRDEGTGEGCFAVDRDDRNQLGNYLCVYKGKGGYAFRPFSELNARIGNVAQQTVTSISGLYFSTMASVWGRGFGSRVSVITESDPGTGMVGLFSIDANYGIDATVAVAQLEAYGFNFQPPWRKEYTIALDSAVSRYCRDHYYSVDTYNRTLGGKFNSYDGNVVAFTCL